MPRKEINIPVGTVVGKNTKGSFQVIKILNTKETERVWDEMGKAKPHDPGYQIRFKCGKTYYTLKTQVYKCMAPNDVGWRTCYNCDGSPGKKCRWDQQNFHSISVVPNRDVEIKPGDLFNELRIIDFAFNAKRHNYYEFECTKCGARSFHMPPSNTSDLNACHCAACADIKYRGPKVIAQYLDKYHIPYQREFKFDNCRYKATLPFDFAIFYPTGQLKCLIEYDGEQHYKFIKHWHGDDEGFKLQQLRDKIKTEYCKQNKIKLIRIPYTEYENIEKILKDNMIF